MKTVELQVAEAGLAGLVDEAAGGEEIIIAREGKPVARLSSVEPRDFRRTFGCLKDKMHMTDDFDAPLPPDIAEAFGMDE